MIKYLCVLFVAGVVERRRQRTVREHVEVGRNCGRKQTKWIDFQGNGCHIHLSRIEQSVETGGQIIPQVLFKV
jgi:hypothetical protein